MSGVFNNVNNTPIVVTVIIVPGLEELVLPNINHAVVINLPLSPPL